MTKVVLENWKLSSSKIIKSLQFLTKNYFYVGVNVSNSLTSNFKIFCINHLMTRINWLISTYLSSTRPRLHSSGLVFSISELIIKAPVIYITTRQEMDRIICCRGDEKFFLPTFLGTEALLSHVVSMIIWLYFHQQAPSSSHFFLKSRVFELLAVMCPEFLQCIKTFF